VLPIFGALLGQGSHGWDFEHIINKVNINVALYAEALQITRFVECFLTPLSTHIYIYIAESQSKSPTHSNNIEHEYQVELCNVQSIDNCALNVITNTIQT
jgi:hypothetical protein